MEMNVKRYQITEDIEYQFSLVSGLGHILTRKGPSVVEKGKPIKVFQNCTPSHYETLYFSHKNLLRREFKNEKNRHLVCEVPEISLDESIRRWNLGRGHRKVISKCKIPYPVSDGEIKTTGGIEVEYLHPAIRQIFCQMFEFVGYVHNHNYSLTNFGLDDLSMKGEIVQFCGVGFVSNPNSTSRKENFECVVRAINVLLARLGFEATSGLKDLFSLTKSLEYESLMDGQALTLHLSILPPEKVLKFMKKCHNEIGGNKKKDYALALTLVPDCSSWNSKFINKPGLKMVEDCFLKEGLASYAQCGHFNEDKISMYRFTRYIAKHLGKNIKEGTIDNVKKESIIMYLFEDELLCTQRGLHQMGTLHDFMI